MDVDRQEGSKHMASPSEGPEIDDGAVPPLDRGDDSSVLSPGDALRSLPAEAERRGTRYVSARAMQARLFSVYDAAAAAEGALALVQHQLTRTLDRRYYEPNEIETMAAQLDALLVPDTTETDETEQTPDVAPDQETADRGDTVGVVSE
jgi:hypothetical protein